MNKSYLNRIILASIVLLFSLQLFRVFMATVMWNLGFYLGSSYMLALFGLCVFAMALVAPLLCRAIGEQNLLGLTAAGIALIRLAIQFVRNPLALVIISTVGIILFEWFLPLMHHSARDGDGKPGIPVLVTAFPIAVLVDTGSRTLLLSYDILWRRHAPWAAVIAGAAAVLLFLLWREIKDSTRPQTPGTSQPQPSLPLAALGPWLYLSMAVFQNPQAVMGITGYGDIAAHITVNAINAAGMIICPVCAAASFRRSLLWRMVPGIVCMVAMYIMVNHPGCSLMWTAMGGSAMWALAGFIFAGGTADSERGPALWRSGLAVFLGFLMLLVFVFIHAEFKIFGATVAAAGMLLVLSVFFKSGEAEVPAVGSLSGILRITAAAAVIVMLSVTVWVVSSPLPVGTSAGEKKGGVRIVTYNIHQSFDANYRIDLEGIADTIAALKPDIVGLQEVNRAQVVNGMTDCLGLISRRLNMPYVYGGNHDDRQYGNAILSRFPIGLRENRRFTHNSTEVRGVLHAVVKSPIGDLDVFVTHLDHITGPKNVRKEQAHEVLDFQGGGAYSVVMGDLNAEPDTVEMEVLYKSRLKDSLAEMNMKYKKTFWEGYGEKAMHLDYVFHTPDLKAVNAEIVKSRASDHMPVVIDMTR